MAMNLVHLIMVWNIWSVVYVYELDANLCIMIGTIFAVKISRKFAKNWWISLDQLLWSTEVNYRQNPIEPVSPKSTSSGIRSFSKFDRQQLCSPLTYRPHIYSINRSKPFKKVCQISRLCCLLLGPLWQLKVPLVYFINGQKGGLDCSPLYLSCG